MMASTYLAVILTPAVVLASLLTIPGPTSAIAPDPVQGFRSKITGAARVNDAAIELLRRYVDYDQTCGFVDGNLASALTCSGTNICATNTILGVAGCCDPLSLDSCYLYTACVPSSQLSSCTAASCVSNEAIAKCTDPAAPYCVDWQYNFITTTMAAYGCDVSPFIGSVERTYSGQDLFDISSYLTESIPEFSFPTTVTQTQILSADLASGTAGGSSSNSNSNSNNKNNNNDDDDESHKISIGAIVGGVVGGIGALTILGGLIVLMLWKKRRAKRNAASAAAFHQHQQKQQQQQQQQQQDPMPGPGFGAPHGPNDYKPPHMGPPPLQQQYGAPSPPTQMQQPGNNVSFYTPLPPADTKHTYTQHSVSSVPSTPGPYSPPLSPTPLYSPPAAAPQQQHPDVPQIDGTPVHKNAEGDRVHEAP